MTDNCSHCGRQIGNNEYRFPVVGYTNEFMESKGIVFNLEGIELPSKISTYRDNPVIVAVHLPKEELRREVIDAYGDMKSYLRDFAEDSDTRVWIATICNRELSKDEQGLFAFFNPKYVMNGIENAHVDATLRDIEGAYSWILKKGPKYKELGEMTP